MSMRVLHVYKTYHPDSIGGLENTIFEICHGLRQQHIDTRIFCLSPSANPRVLHLPEADVYRAPLSFEVASCGFSARGLFAFKAQARWADIIHYHFPWPFADVMHFFNRVDTPNVVAYQSDIVKQAKLYKLYSPLMTRFLNQTDAIIASSPHYARTSDVLAKYRDKLHVIPIGLNKQNYPTPDTNCLDKWATKLPTPFFLFVGVLRYYKGLPILLEAINNAPYPVVIAGNGPLEAQLKRQAKQTQLDNAIFLGTVSEIDKFALLQLCRALVFPSNVRTEAYGITLVEAAMSGKPMISTNLGTGTDFINQDNKTGLVVPANDPHALRKALDTLYADAALCEKMGKAAYARYQQYFTADKMVGAHLKLYEHILTASRQPAESKSTQ